MARAKLPARDVFKENMPAVHRPSHNLMPSTLSPSFDLTYEALPDSHSMPSNHGNEDSFGHSPAVFNNIHEDDFFSSFHQNPAPIVVTEVKLAYPTSEYIRPATSKPVHKSPNIDIPNAERSQSNHNINNSHLPRAERSQSNHNINNSHLPQDDDILGLDLTFTPSPLGSTVFAIFPLDS